MVVTVLSGVLTVVSSIIEDKKQEQLIDEKVNKAINSKKDEA